MNKALILLLIATTIGVCLSSTKKYGFSILFQSQGDTDYVSKLGMIPLEAVTSCMWIKSINGNQGAPFSYAVLDTHNELLLEDTSNLDLLVGGLHASSSTVLPVNDGVWHHICFTWENSAGSWNIYKDGSAQKSGTGVQTGYTIRAGGMLTLGQDQDSLGGDFDERQSLVGEISDVNVWNRELSADEIFEMSSSCDAGEGNVFKWSDFQSGVRGGARVIQPTTCIDE